jgi:hypothetical protein
VTEKDWKEMEQMMAGVAHFIHENDREAIRCDECGGRAFVHTVSLHNLCGKCAEMHEVEGFTPEAAK